jgi:hypothetical protein
MQRPPDFSIAALHGALDAQRKARGLSWEGLTREINAQFADSRARPLSSSTVSGLRTKSFVEADGVLQMLRWLGRTAESFVPGLVDEATTGATPRKLDAHQILRFDVTALHAALDARRLERALTWAQVADEIGGANAALLTRLAKGGRVAFPQVMRVIRWVGQPAATFTRASDW